MKKVLLVVWLLSLLGSVAGIFWKTDLVYSMPTPMPARYHPLMPGDMLKLDMEVSNKPVFLHFFNPGCPCSRFNISHFKSLVKQYGQKVSFRVVVMTDKQFSVKEIQDKFGLNIPVSFDKSIADACGVYSTPQAVIIDSTQRLYYRGNYNKSRYCSDKNSNYAELALKAYLGENINPVNDSLALKAYGCKLPSCTK